ncbi:glycosyltransferase family protein [Thalassospira sp. MCCC 1A01428]|uniref:glycosyltransferase family protein n=1 Tax=Thalassospira sp. MCCC 1A01428 TaxID=1470575 RepID=UPI000A1DB80A|nr:glycosyltransferase [Thalassospira sp. MCCC 1A01428]OSQ42839.1 glycosyl transferase [Thalassospira sp. MCCC 1A01428]
MTDVMIYVQHLLGIGHVRRTALLVQEIQKTGLSVGVVSGGIPDDAIDFGTDTVIQLPPCRSADHGFSGLVDENGTAVDDAWKTRRQQALFDAYRDLSPELLMIEMFPFGRRAFRFELLPLLEKAGQDGVKRVCSVRDLLVRKTDIAKERWMRDVALSHFDTILVHGDPVVFGFDRSFPFAGDLSGKLEYTGYVAPQMPQGRAPRNGVMVSAGGGAVGVELIRTAIAAMPHSQKYADVPWDIITGPHFPAEDFAAINRHLPQNMTLHRFLSDFRHRLTRASASVSQAGYNTLMDVLAAGVPSVMVPFAEGGESEQTERAEIFAAKNIISLLPAPQLTPLALAKAIDNADFPKEFELSLDGARIGAAKIRAIIMGKDHGHLG